MPQNFESLFLTWDYSVMPESLSSFSEAYSSSKMQYMKNLHKTVNNILKKLY